MKQHRLQNKILDPKRSPEPALSPSAQLRVNSVEVATFRSGMTKACHNTRGTTLVEMILYFTLVGTIMFAAMIFAIQILTIRAVSENRNELTANRDFIIEKMGAYVREADSINEENSIFDNDAGALSLNKSLASLTPITLFISSGNLFVQKGTSDPERLNSDFVTVQSLRFHRVTFSKAPDQIVIDSVLTSLAGDIPNLNKTADIHISISLRRL